MECHGVSQATRYNKNNVLKEFYSMNNALKFLLHLYKENGEIQSGRKKKKINIETRAYKHL